MADSPEKPALTVIAGPNGAGKSTVFDSLKATGYEPGPFVNPDNIARSLPAGTKNPELVAGRLAVQEARDHIAAKQSFSQETTLTGNFALNLMRDAKAAGYAVNVIYVGVDAVDVSKDRVANRVAKGGHDIPEADQARRFERSRSNIPAAARLADNMAVLDNSSLLQPYRPAVDIERGQVRSIKPDAPGWARRAVAELPTYPEPERARRPFAQQIEGATERARASTLADRPAPTGDKARQYEELRNQVRTRDQQRGKLQERDRGRGDPDR